LRFGEVVSPNRFNARDQRELERMKREREEDRTRERNAAPEEDSNAA